MVNKTRRSSAKILLRINPEEPYQPSRTPNISGSSKRKTNKSELDVPVLEDFENKNLAMARLNARPFVKEANASQFHKVQKWIEECGQEVRLPINFCGGLLIIRFYRLITPSKMQTSHWMQAIYEVAAAYDFAFLALGHADDEADATIVRDGKPTRFTTHPDTRAVDGINLLLLGITAMQDALEKWPSVDDNSEAIVARRNSLAFEIINALTRALREASFPILLDRAGVGHVSVDTCASGSLAPILVDSHSLDRVETYACHRAQTYFMRATELSVLLAGYDEIAAELTDALEKLYGHWGSMGAATDDLQDIFIDFPAGTHSICTVLAHLCVAEDVSLRPDFTRNYSKHSVADCRDRLSAFFGNSDDSPDRLALMNLFEEIGLRQALLEHLEKQGTLFATAIHEVAVEFGYSPKLMIEIVSVVCGDPDFLVPDAFLTALETRVDEDFLELMSVQAGKFIASYIVNRFWPQKTAA